MACAFITQLPPASSLTPAVPPAARPCPSLHCTLMHATIRSRPSISDDADQHARGQRKGKGTKSFVARGAVQATCLTPTPALAVHQMEVAARAALLLKSELPATGLGGDEHAHEPKPNRVVRGLGKARLQRHALLLGPCGPFPTPKRATRGWGPQRSAARQRRRPRRAAAASDGASGRGGWTGVVARVELCIWWSHLWQADVHAKRPRTGPIPGRPTRTEARAHHQAPGQVDVLTRGESLDGGAQVGVLLLEAEPPCVRHHHVLERKRLRGDGGGLGLTLGLNQGGERARMGGPKRPPSALVCGAEGLALDQLAKLGPAPAAGPPRRRCCC